jgi:hypothetical protein
MDLCFIFYVFVLSWVGAACGVPVFCPKNRTKYLNDFQFQKLIHFQCRYAYLCDPHSYILFY